MRNFWNSVKVRQPEAATDHRHTWVICRAVPGKFLSDDLAAQSEGQILGGSPSVAGTHPVPDRPSHSTSESGGVETPRWGDWRRGWTAVCKATEGHCVCRRMTETAGRPKPLRRLSLSSLPRHTEPVGKQTHQEEGAWKLTTGEFCLPSRRVRNHSFGGKA